MEENTATLGWKFFIIRKVRTIHLWNLHPVYRLSCDQFNHPTEVTHYNNKFKQFFLVFFSFSFFVYFCIFLGLYHFFFVFFFLMQSSQLLSVEKWLLIDADFSSFFLFFFILWVLCVLRVKAPKVQPFIFFQDSSSDSVKVSMLKLGKSSCRFPYKISCQICI